MRAVRRVAVIGCGGSGKTTLANELAARLDLPVVHIDSHYWRIVDGERVESTPEQWRGCHRGLIAADEWVIDGMKLGVLAERLARADTVIYLDLPTRECLGGILRRRVRYRGRLRHDLGVYDRIDREFLRWVWSFRRRHRPALLKMLDGFDGERIVLRSRREVGRFPARSPRVTARSPSPEPQHKSTSVPLPRCRRAGRVMVAAAFRLGSDGGEARGRVPTRTPSDFVGGARLPAAIAVLAVREPCESRADPVFYWLLLRRFHRSPDWSGSSVVSGDCGP